VPGAINLPHGKIIALKLAQWPEDAIFVTYCAGPHCNGAARGGTWPSRQNYGWRCDWMVGRRVRPRGRSLAQRDLADALCPSVRL
jgi:hypothetical protein